MAEGQRDREDALARAGFSREFLVNLNGLRVGRDDFLDACADAWTARRIFSGTARRFPPEPDLDRRGLDQAIRF